MKPLTSQRLALHSHLACLRPHGSTTVTHQGLNWHVFTADVYSDHFVFKVDSVTCTTSNFGATGRLGVIMQNAIAQPGSWASGGAQCDPLSPGPWDTLVDYVRVYALRPKSRGHSSA